MLLSFSNLEEALADPEAYRQQLQADKKPFIPRGRHGAMRSTLMRWHKGKITIAAAREEFISKCDKLEVPPGEVLDQFDDYVQDYSGSGAKSPLARMRVRIPLPEGADPRFRIGAEVCRLDRKADETYTAWLYRRLPADWTTEVRLPLLQAAVAQHLNIELEEIEIAIYCFTTRTSHRFKFTEAQVLKANSQLRGLLTELAPLVASEPVPEEALQMSLQF